MIRVTRPNEPHELTAERAVRLPKARLTHQTAVLLPADLKGYEIVKRLLWQAQHRKCVYCEAPARASFEDVEHFRPKLRALRGAAYPTYGYWWLCWTWANLLFSCPVCNRSHKKDYFPLFDGSTILAPDEQPPGSELAVLVDPADPQDDDPLDLIRYVRVADRWRPTGRDGNARGAEIVRVLGLDGPEHLDRYEAHVDEHVMPDVAAVQAAVAAMDQPGLQTCWDQAIRHARPLRAWAALAYDVLDHFFPAPQREILGLDLPRP